MRRLSGGGRLRGLCGLGFLVRLVVADGAAHGSTRQRMMPGDMACHAAHGRTRRAAGAGRQR